MGGDVFYDFTKIETLNIESIYALEKQFPNDYIDLLTEYGLGIFGKGYFRFIDPMKYQVVVLDGYLYGKEAIPFMATAFGDLFVWQRNKYIYMIRFRHSLSIAVGRNFKVFFNNLSNDTFRNDFLKDDLYNEAVDIYGIPSFEECFGFFPLISAGGKEVVTNIQRVKMREYIMLNTQFSGKISAGTSIF